MKINTFRSDLTDISAKKEPLIRNPSDFIYATTLYENQYWQSRLPNTKLVELSKLNHNTTLLRCRCALACAFPSRYMAHTTSYRQLASRRTRCIRHSVLPVNIQTLSNIRSRVESRYSMRFLIRNKGCNRLALVNTRTSFWRMLSFWIMIQNTDEKRDCLHT